MSVIQTNVVKQQVAAHWNRRAARSAAVRMLCPKSSSKCAAWDRILDLAVPQRGALDVLDVGCGTGFLSFELAARGHRVIGIDFALAMLAEARRKAAQRGVPVRFEEGDAEQLPFAPGTFDLVISRHLLWTLPHPEAAIDEWIRVLRPSGRLIVVDGQFDSRALSIHQRENARTSTEYAAIGDQLPFLGGRPREEIEALLKAHGLVDVRSDPVLDLVEAQAQRMIEEGRELIRRGRYVAWGEVGR